jgi:hypothetical protein
VEVVERLRDDLKEKRYLGAEDEAREREWEEGGREGVVLSMLHVSLPVNHYYCCLVLPSYIAKASVLTIFPCILQGAFFAWKATAMGKNYINGKTFLEKR